MNTRQRGACTCTAGWPLNLLSDYIRFYPPNLLEAYSLSSKSERRTWRLQLQSSHPTCVPGPLEKAVFKRQVPDLKWTNKANSFCEESGAPGAQKHVGLRLQESRDNADSKAKPVIGSNTRVGQEKGRGPITWKLEQLEGLRLDGTLGGFWKSGSKTGHDSCSLFAHIARLKDDRLAMNARVCRPALPREDQVSGLPTVHKAHWIPGYSGYQVTDSLLQTPGREQRLRTDSYCKRRRIAECPQNRVLSAWNPWSICETGNPYGRPEAKQT